MYNISCIYLFFPPCYNVTHAVQPFHSVYTVCPNLAWSCRCNICLVNKTICAALISCRSVSERGQNASGLPDRKRKSEKDRKMDCVWGDARELIHQTQIVSQAHADWQEDAMCVWGVCCLGLILHCADSSDKKAAVVSSHHSSPESDRDKTGWWMNLWVCVCVCILKP